METDICMFMIISGWILLRMRNVSGKSCRENQDTHFVLNFFFRKPCRLWDNVEKYSASGKVKWQYSLCSLHAGYLRLQTHSEYVILIAFPLQQRLHKAPNVTLYVHFLYCYVLDTSSYYSVKDFFFCKLWTSIWDQKKVRMFALRAIIWPFVNTHRICRCA